MGSYTQLLQLHLLLALLSGGLFAARGAWRLWLLRPIRSRFWRVVPHALDTLLLLSGVTLAVLLRLSPHAAPWFATKLLLVVLYIGVGIAAMRASRPAAARTLHAAALLTWFLLLGTALNRHPLGWLG